MVDESTRGQGSERESRCPETFHATFDWAEVAPAEAVVQAVRIALDRDPTTVEPLTRRVDPGALDDLVFRGDGAPDQDGVRVSFTFADRFVTVNASGVVVVQPVDVG